jgi:hypothetical protein
MRSTCMGPPNVYGLTGLYENCVGRVIRESLSEGIYSQLFSQFVQELQKQLIISLLSHHEKCMLRHASLVFSLLGLTLTSFLKYRAFFFFLFFFFLFRAHKPGN